MTGGAISLLSVTYAIDNAAGVGQFLAVVQGAADGSVKLPTAQNAAQFLGFTQASQAYQNGSVPVMRLGISPAVAGGAISRGDHVAINSAAGDVYSVEAAVASGLNNPAKVFNVVGTAENTVANVGDIVYVYIKPELIALAVS
jgi:hypothetical protein